MSILDDIDAMVTDGEKRLVEIKQVIDVLKESGENVTERLTAYNALKKRIEGLRRGLKKYG